MTNNNIDKDMKEAIVRKLCDGWVGGMTHGDEQRIVYPAMDEYAELLSIEFAEFIKDNNYTRNINSDDSRWYKYFQQREDLPSGVTIMSGVSEYFTTKELFQLFIQSKASKNGK